MDQKITSGLGELLRYVSELVEHGAEEHYKIMGINYRARYTPVLRAIQAGATTVTQITSLTHVTQGAISQAVGQMEKDGLLYRTQMQDGRKSILHLTSQGELLLERLTYHWEVTFTTIDELELELGYPVRLILTDMAMALERKSFAERLLQNKVNSRL